MLAERTERKTQDNENKSALAIPISEFGVCSCGFLVYLP